MKASSALLPALLGVLLFAALPASLFAERELLIVSPHWEGVRTEFGAAFAAWYQQQTGDTVRVRWIDFDGGTSSIEKALDAAYRANPATSGIDVFFGGGMDPYADAKRKGQLAPFRLPDEILSVIPPAVAGVPLVDPDFCYYGAAISSFGILENVRIRDRLGLPPVASWEDLARPGLFDWVSAADPRKSGSVHMIYEIILQAYGWDAGWSVLYRMGGNIRSFFDASAAPAKELGAGDAAEAITIDINGKVEEASLGPENVRFVIPPGLSVLTPDGIGILKGAPNPDVAKAFVTFVMSAPGQSLWMEPLGAPGGPRHYPISRMGVWPPLYAAHPELPNPFQMTSGFTYNGDLGSRRWGVVNDLMGQTIIDVHARLQTAWKAILRLPASQQAPLLAELVRPPVTEAEALDLARTWRTDPVHAGALRNQWMIAADARYRSLAERAAQLAAHPQP